MQITFEHVSFRYRPRQGLPRLALADVCLELDTRRIIGVCGLSGSGKSTFVRHLNGLLKPDCGKVRLDGENVHHSAATLRRARQRIGMTCQFPERQLFAPTVSEEFALTFALRGVAPTEIDRRIRAVAAALHFDVARFAVRSPFSLSLAEQRKLGIAVILTLQPELIVFDEPTAGMDRANASRFLDVLRDLARRQQYQMMFVSHHIDVLFAYADDVLLLDQGKAIFFGAVAELLRQPAVLETVGLALPPVTQTIQLLRRAYPAIPPAIVTVDDAVQSICTHIPRPPQTS